VSDSFDRIRTLSESCWEAIATRPCSGSGQRVAVPETVPIETARADGRYSDSYPVLEHL
jgi:hypothetical protein